MRKPFRRIVAHILALCTIFIISFIRTPQKIELGSFSYPIYILDKNGKTFSGSCTFVEKNGNLYLLTAKHCLNGYNNWIGSKEVNIDSVFIMFTEKRTSHTNILRIKINEKSLIKTHDDIFSPDIAALNITDLVSIHNISVINGFLKAPAGYIATNSYACYGFKSTDQQWDNVLNQFQPVRASFRCSKVERWSDYLDHLKLAANSAKRKSDSLYFSHYCTRLTPFLPEGFSGAPVFQIFRAKSGDIKYVFAGINYGGQPAENKTWMVSINGFNELFDHLN